MIGPLRDLRGVRLFFPLALAFSAVSIPVWLLQYAGILGPLPHFAGPAWHGHEMVFGYVAAAAAGFLTVGDRGWRMLALAALWLAGRLVLFTPAPPWVAALVDCSFLPLLVILRRPRLWTGAKLMTIGIAAVLGLLTVLNLWAHLAPDPSRAVRTASLAVLTLIVVVAGRLVPGHTRAATRRGPGLTLVRSEQASLVLAAVLIAADATASTTLAGSAAAALASLQAYRLWHWWDRKALLDPLLWGLHLGYAWLAAGLAGYAAGTAGWVPIIEALHFALIGAVGTLTLAVMMRLMRAQAGEAQKGARVEAAILLLVTLAVVARAVLPLVVSEWRLAGTVLGAGCWSAAALLTCVVYAPRLNGRSRSGRRPPG